MIYFNRESTLIYNAGTQYGFFFNINSYVAYIYISHHQLYYKIIPSKQVGEGMMGTQHVYDVTAAIKVPGPAPHEATTPSTAASAAPSGEASQKVHVLSNDYV